MLSQERDSSIETDELSILLFLRNTSETVYFDDITIEAAVD
ncbi:MAG: hypothetical protein AAF824_09760 [Bacteroidota bacterium]